MSECKKIAESQYNIYLNSKIPFWRVLCSPLRTPTNRIIDYTGQIAGVPTEMLQLHSTQS